VHLVSGIQPRAISASFDAFYAAEYRAVLAFAVTLCRDRHAAEDVVQDAFVAAQRRWDELAGFDRPAQWVRRVVANRSVSRWRQLASDERRVRRLAALPAATEAGGPDADSHVWDLVRRLPPRQAQVIALVYLEDRTLAETAEILGIGAETAKTHLQRGKAALARALGTQEDTP